MNRIFIESDYRNTPSGRKAGTTTRFVDAMIQKLFENDAIFICTGRALAGIHKDRIVGYGKSVKMPIFVIDENYAENESKKYTISRLLKRCDLEHPNQIEVKNAFNGQIIKIKK